MTKAIDRQARMRERADALYRGAFYNGALYNGTLKALDLCRGAFYDGAFYNGALYNGTLKALALYRGAFYAGAFYNGALYNGALYNGMLRAVALYDGAFYNGTLKALDLCRGALYDGLLRAVGLCRSAFRFGGATVGVVIVVGFSSSALAQWENLADFSDALPETTEQDAVPANRVELKNKAFFRAINDPTLNSEIKANYAAIQDLLGKGNAFNLALSEQYLSYALLLREAARMDEATQALVDAMHIQKVNYGLYDPRHRAILKLLFDFNFERQQPLTAEEYLRRLLLLEEQLDGKPSDDTFAMLNKMGHYYLDAYQWTAKGNEKSKQHITTAASYFGIALARFNDRPMSERMLPYGEYTYSELLLSIALAKESALLDYDRHSTMEEQAQKARMRDMRSRHNATKALEQFLSDAHEQNNQSMVVRALISLGDLNQMTRRSRDARYFYEQAWDAAQGLAENDPQRLLFKQVRKLPDFLFSDDWTHADNPEKTRITVPVLVSVNAKGSVTKIQQVSPKGRYNDGVYIYAKRSLTDFSFRPIMIDGEFVAMKAQPYEAEILVNKSWLERLIAKDKKEQTQLMSKDAPDEK